MLKQRRRAAELVAADFLEAERAADEAAAKAATCMSTMLVQRNEANFPIGAGMEALQLVSEASSALIVARRKLVEAHQALALLRDQAGYRMLYGDELECPPMAINDEASFLRVVAAA